MSSIVLSIFLLSIGASFIQRTTGFGFGIFIMTMLPFLMPTYADATFYAISSDGNHRISFDHVVEVMKRTGHDLPSLYKETSEGGLALEYKE